jgi:UDP-GlcNAc:undecaprenyl-phosphate/decaprenyl-phosphate GlcNAc-1-phosphate transferase
MIEFFVILFFIILNYYFFSNFYKISLFLNIFDKPSKRKIHKSKVASNGGVFFLINFLLILIAGYLFKIKLFYFNFDSTLQYLVFILTFILFFILGFLDDKNNLSYKTKFIFTILFLFFLIKIDNNLTIDHLKFSFLEKPLLLGNFAIPFTILCILLFINSCNMIDGLNLLSVSYFFFIIFFFIFLKCISVFFLLLFFYYVFFIYLNYKSKIFLGDNGTLSISFVLSYFFIKSYNSNLITNVDIIFIIMSVPGLDMFRLFLERVFNKKNPFKADSNHLHHLLLFKFQNKNIASLLMFFTLIFPYFLTFTKLSNFLVILIILLIYFTILVFLKTNKRKKNG